MIGQAVTVLAGVLVGGGISSFTAWLGRRHEHSSWLLDRRLEAYVAFNAAELAFEIKAGKAKADPGELQRMIDASVELGKCLQPVRLLAEPAVRDRSSRVVGLVKEASLRLARFHTGKPEATADHVRDVMQELDAEAALLLADQQSELGDSRRRLSLRQKAR